MVAIVAARSAEVKAPLLPSAISSKSPRCSPLKSHFCQNTRRCYYYSFLFILFVAISVIIVSYADAVKPSIKYFKNLHVALKPYLGMVSNASLSNSFPEAEVEIEPTTATTTTSSLNNKRKTVLFWTDFFGDHWKSHFAGFRKGGHLPGSDDESLNRTCYFTKDKHRLDEADAVIFHGRDFSFGNLPKSRRPSQRWTFYLLESPHHSGFNTDTWARATNLKFNWSMTYHRSSDVWVPYMEVRKEASSLNLSLIEESNANFVESFAKRPRDAFWYVSNCHTPSRREVLSSELNKLGLKVDMFGGCSGKRPDAEIKEKGEAAFVSQYKFYLSLENSLCDDYITEKFGRGMSNSLNYGVIPIAYGSNDYSKIAPEGSYIRADSFPNVTALVDNLKELVRSKERIAGYYEWRKSFDTVDVRFPRIGFTHLCKKLFTEDETGCRATNIGKPALSPCQPKETVIASLQDRIGKCRSPSLAGSS